MTKRNAREMVLHLLFQLEFNKDTTVESLKNTVSGDIFDNIEDFEFYGKKVPEILKMYVESVVLGTLDKKEEIDALIAKYSTDWDISRISKLSLTILRLAIYEIAYCDDIPVSASINEAVELTKIYDADNSSKFINGILGTYARSLNV